MAERLEDLLIKAGIEEFFARPFCKGLGPENPAWIEEFKRSPMDWFKLVHKEREMFASLAAFTTDERFERQMVPREPNKQKRLLYIHHMHMLRIMYGGDYEKILKILRARFKRWLLANVRENAWKVFWWDNHWCNDPDLRGPMLEAIEAVSSEDRKGALPPPPFIEDSAYKQKVLFPVLAPLKALIDYDAENTVLVDRLYRTGITGLTSNAIRTNFMHGRTDPKKGFKNYKAPVGKRHPAEQTELWKAFCRRLRDADQKARSAWQPAEGEEVPRNRRSKEHVTI